MRRVAVVGPGGSGKTTFAKRLGPILNLPVIHLDHHYWSPGWVETPRAQWVQIQERLVAEDAWVIDGNYGGTVDLRLRRADTLIVLDYPRWIFIPRAVLRALRRGSEQAPGCPQRVTREFFEWLWSWPTGGRRRLLVALERHPDGPEVIFLKSPRASRRLLANLKGADTPTVR